MQGFDDLNILGGKILELKYGTPMLLADYPMICKKNFPIRRDFLPEIFSICVKLLKNGTIMHLCNKLLHETY